MVSPHVSIHTRILYGLWPEKWFRHLPTKVPSTPPLSPGSMIVLVELLNQAINMKMLQIFLKGRLDNNDRSGCFSFEGTSSSLGSFLLLLEAAPPFIIKVSRFYFSISEVYQNHKGQSVAAGALQHASNSKGFVFSLSYEVATMFEWFLIWCCRIQSAQMSSEIPPQLKILIKGRLATNVFLSQGVSPVTAWGRMSLCDAERRLLANALLDINNERFVLLSESCIPLYNFNIIYHYLMNSIHSFMGAFDDPGPYGRGRYNPNMAPEVKITQWRKSSQWFEVNRKLAVTMVEDTKFYPKFEEFCRPACYVDEHYFPTMLTIQAGHLLANRTITWVDWSRGGPHPGSFGKKDITEAFFKRILENHTCLYNDQPSPVCFLFARKFVPNALEPLLQLSPKFLGY